jgi:hypothetical protein
MPDVQSWYQGADCIGQAERVLRVNAGDLPTRVRAAAEQLASAREEQFPEYLWPELRELRLAGATGQLSGAEATRFADELARLRDRLDLEISGRSQDFLSCPRCDLRLIPGTLRVDGGIAARLLGKAVLVVRFRPEGKNHEERRINALDNLNALVCPVCEAILLDINLER